VILKQTIKANDWPTVPTVSTTLLTNWKSTQYNTSHPSSSIVVVGEGVVVGVVVVVVFDYMPKIWNSYVSQCGRQLF